MSIEYRLPDDFPQDPDEITREQSEEWMREVRIVRRTRNIALSRFVKALNAAGYEINIDEYTMIEKAPRLAHPHVQEYLLQYCAKVLNRKRVIGSAQSQSTARAMYALTAARTAKEWTYEQVAEGLTKLGIPVSAAQYRTAEQGITRTVPFDLIDGACDVLGIALGGWKE